MKLYDGDDKHAWYIDTYSYQQALRTCKSRGLNLGTCCDPVQTGPEARPQIGDLRLQPGELPEFNQS